MRKLMLTICLVLGLVIMAAPALADSWNVNDVITYTLSNSVGTSLGSGGLFTITNTNTGVVINTFCLELNEHIYQNDRVAGISDSAVLGGRGGGSPDPISDATDWLYAQYIAGNAAYSDPKALQIAFWILEEEMISSEADNWAKTYGWTAELATANNYITEALKHNGSYGTQVLNLKAANTETDHQSHLIHVPEPGILILLGIALSAVGLVARRFKI